MTEPLGRLVTTLDVIGLSGPDREQRMPSSFASPGPGLHARTALSGSDDRTPCRSFLSLHTSEYTRAGRRDSSFGIIGQPPLKRSPAWKLRFVAAWRRPNERKSSSSFMAITTRSTTRPMRRGTSAASSGRSSFADADVAGRRVARRFHGLQRRPRIWRVRRQRHAEGYPRHRRDTGPTRSRIDRAQPRH